MMKSFLIFNALSVLTILSSCAPIDENYAPAYSIYQPPLELDYYSYHQHDEHQHNHDHDKNQGDHYHPNNQWDKIAYKAASQNLSPQGIKNINAMTAQKKP